MSKSLKKFTPLLLVMLLLTIFCYGQERNINFSLKISVSNEIRDDFNSKGRLFIFLNKSPNAEPRKQTWPSSSNFYMAKNYSDFESSQILTVDDFNDWIKTPSIPVKGIPEGEYYLQVLWDQDTDESRVTAPGNIYSIKQKITIGEPFILNVLLEKITVAPEIEQHKLVRMVNFKSDTLSKWWDKPMFIKATVLLPVDYDINKEKSYPVRYNIAGYGGRYTRINWLINQKDFMDWWVSDDAPQIISVFLDGEAPFGDSYQVNSDNNGPYGDAIVHELIPFIEKKYRGTSTAKTRFVEGCSTGGWGSLALQLFYPDHFNGAFSYSPDPVTFQDYQLINIYKDENAFVNEYDFLRPLGRSIKGEPFISMKEMIMNENVLGASNSYLDSGGQISAHTAAYSKKGENNLPKPLFNPLSGEIDSTVAKEWERYDLKRYAEKNWAVLGPKIQGKIFISMGDMDNFYLNLATRSLDYFFKKTENPKSDAEIIFTPMQGHCTQYSHKIVLQQIEERIKKINKDYE